VETERESSVRALDKALNIIEHLSKLDRDIDLATLTQEMKMPKTTLLRLLNTLKKHNFVQQDEQSKRYRLGWALIYLGQAANRAFDLVEFVHPYLEKLSRESGETANLVFLDGNHAVYVDQVVSANIIRGVPSAGAPLGLHCTAAGKVLLSCLPDDQVEKILSAVDLPSLTANTITDPTELRRELEQARGRGYALDDEETEIGGRCLAAPIRNKKSSVVAAISVIGPVNRINPGTYSNMSALVLAAAGEISRALGYREPAS